jgi:hypothetical protein
MIIIDRRFQQHYSALHFDSRRELVANLNTIYRRELSPNKFAGNSQPLYENSTECREFLAIYYYCFPLVVFHKCLVQIHPSKLKASFQVLKCRELLEHKL